MNYESAKFANVNVLFLKINLMRCPATRFYTILYTRNELILLTNRVCIVFMFTYIVASIPFVLIDMTFQSPTYEFYVLRCTVLMY